MLKGKPNDAPALNFSGLPNLSLLLDFSVAFRGVVSFYLEEGLKWPMAPGRAGLL